MSLYDDPEIYDIVHSGATEQQLGALLRLAKGWRLTPQDGLWLEPACGSGRLLAAISDLGYPAAGFDREPSMVEYTRRRLGDAARIEVADLESFIPPFEPRSVGFGFNLINTIRHLESDEALRRHLEQMSIALAAGGRYVVGISLCDYSDRLIEEDVWRGETDGVSVVQVVQALPPGPRRQERIVSHLVIHREGEDEPEHRDDRYSLRSYSPREWEEGVHDSPLIVEAVFDLDGDPLPSLDVGYSLVVLRNPTAP